MSLRLKLFSLYKKLIRMLSGHGLGRLYPIKALHVAVLNSLKSKRADIEGHKMTLDKQDAMSLSLNGIYERQETEFVKKEVKPGQTVIDIGAHIGYYTLIFARLVGPNGTVYAFEPEPTNFSTLQNNIRLNGYKNIISINKAVAEENKILNLYVNDNHSGDHRIYDTGEGRKVFKIEGINLGDFLKDKKFDFIKMDIQGAEGIALKSMASLLKDRSNIKVLSEFDPAAIKKCGMEPLAYLKLWQELGFELYNINRKTRKIEKIDSLNSLLGLYTIENAKSTNLIAIK